MSAKRKVSINKVLNEIKRLQNTVDNNTVDFGGVDDNGYVKENETVKSVYSSLTKLRRSVKAAEDQAVNAVLDDVATRFLSAANNDPVVARKLMEIALNHKDELSDEKEDDSTSLSDNDSNNHTPTF